MTNLDLPALRKRLDELAAAQADSRAQDWSDLMDSLGATFIHHGYELIRAAEERDALLAAAKTVAQWFGHPAACAFNHSPSMEDELDDHRDNCDCGVFAMIRAIRLAKEPR